MEQKLVIILDFLTVAQKNIICRQQCFSSFTYVACFYSWIQYIEIKEHNDSKYIQHLLQIGSNESLLQTESKQKGEMGMFEFLKDNCLILPSLICIGSLLSDTSMASFI